jgi:hypothetical protein
LCRPYVGDHFRNTSVMNDSSIYFLLAHFCC